MKPTYLIISRTNWLHRNTIKVARQYIHLLSQKGIHPAFYTSERWAWIEKSPAFAKVEKEVLIPADRLPFILPEYNGSIPGVLKRMIDISDHRTIWQKKKHCLQVFQPAGRATYVDWKI